MLYAVALDDHLRYSHAGEGSVLSECLQSGGRHDADLSPFQLCVPLVGQIEVDHHGAALVQFISTMFIVSRLARERRSRV
jgi:hypothetical protein